MSHNIGDRMKKNYENCARYYLTRRTPVIIRIDGRAFHTYTQGFIKPFDKLLQNAMAYTMERLCNEIQGAIVGYTQSDEINILLQDWATLQTDAWFGYNVTKVASVSASIATRTFNQYIISTGRVTSWAEFDSRCFNIPLAEVSNYFVWRAKDWYRNSVTMLAQAHFSHKQLLNKSCSDMHDMLHQKGLNWATDLDEYSKNGLFMWKTRPDMGHSVWYRDDTTRCNFEEINKIVTAALPPDPA